VRVTSVHLPAVNTPQFGWVRSRLTRKAKPVPPIYQPEVAAEAIVWASKHARREWYVGGSTAVVIAAQKIAPTLVDYYLAWTGYDAQQHDGFEDPRRADNLFGPVSGDHGAHGEFDEDAHSRSAQFWLNRHRAGVLLASLVGGVWLCRRRFLGPG
jgi:hypothetical protein